MTHKEVMENTVCRHCGLGDLPHFECVAILNNQSAPDWEKEYDLYRHFFDKDKLNIFDDIKSFFKAELEKAVERAREEGYVSRGVVEGKIKDTLIKNSPNRVMFQEGEKAERQRLREIIEKKITELKDTKRQTGFGDIFASLNSTILVLEELLKELYGN